MQVKLNDSGVKYHMKYLASNILTVLFLIIVT